MDFEEFKIAYKECRKQGMSDEQIIIFANEAGANEKAVKNYISSIKKEGEIEKTIKWYSLLSKAFFYSAFSYLVIIVYKHNLISFSERSYFLDLIWLIAIFIFPVINSFAFLNKRLSIIVLLLIGLSFPFLLYLMFIGPWIWRGFIYLYPFFVISSIGCFVYFLVLRLIKPLWNNSIWKGRKFLKLLLVLNFILIILLTRDSLINKESWINGSRLIGSGIVRIENLQQQALGNIEEIYKDSKKICNKIVSRNAKRRCFSIGALPRVETIIKIKKQDLKLPADTRDWEQVSTDFYSFKYPNEKVQYDSEKKILRIGDKTTLKIGRAVIMPGNAKDLHQKTINNDQIWTEDFKSNGDISFLFPISLRSSGSGYDYNPGDNSTSGFLTPEERFGLYIPVGDNETLYIPIGPEKRIFMVNLVETILSTFKLNSKVSEIDHEPVCDDSFSFGGVSNIENHVSRENPIDGSICFLDFVDGTEQRDYFSGLSPSKDRKDILFVYKTGYPSHFELEPEFGLALQIINNNGEPSNSVFIRGEGSNPADKIYFDKGNSFVFHSYKIYQSLTKTFGILSYEIGDQSKRQRFIIRSFGDSQLIDNPTDEVREFSETIGIDFDKMWEGL